VLITAYFLKSILNMAGCNIITDISVDNCRLTLTNQDSEIVAQFLLGNTTYTLFSDRIFIRDTETSWQLYSTAFPIGGLTTMQDLADLIDTSIVGCDSGGGGGSYYLYSENYDAGSFTAQSATGLNSIAMGGNNSQANGDFSIVWGQESISSGFGSMAFGENCNSVGQSSISLGKSSSSNGDASIAIGYDAFAESYVETALGTQNTLYTPISATSFEPTDRLLVVGNGDVVQSDAFTILKNAKVGIDIDNFETTTSDAKLQVNGYINAVLNVYASHAAADADTDLKTDDFYKLTGDRTVYQKP
jgi:hypothetical protein